MSLKSAEFWPNLLKKVCIADKIQSNPTDAVQHEMKKIIESMFSKREICIYPFGSRFMGVAEETSDLDIYVDIGNSFKEYSFSSMHNQKLMNRQEKIAKAFISQSNWMHQASYGGQCPIVKVLYKPSSLNCDISFSNGLTYNQNKLVIYIFEKQPISRYMVIYLRGWIKNIELHEEFRSHILILMVIYFLQLHNFLPGIEKLQKFLAPSIGPWVTTFSKFELSEFGMVQINVEKEQTRKMLQQFFSFYSSFDFAKYAVCPYLGIKVERAFLNNKLPASFNRNHFFLRDDIVVQDFINLNHNKGWIIKKQHYIKFQKNCLIEDH